MADWWQYASNYSNGEGITGVSDLFVKYPSSILTLGSGGGMLGIGLTILIWIFSFSLSMALGARKALTSSSFITFVFSVYFFRMGIVSWLVPIILIVMLIIGALGAKEENL